MSLDHRSSSVAQMLTSEDCRHLCHRFAELAIASSEPTVAEALMAIAFEYASQAAKLSAMSADERNELYNPVGGFGD